MRPKISYVSPQEALSCIQSGNRVFVHGSAQTPTFLLRHLAQEAPRLHDVEIVSITVYGDVYVDKPEFEGHFHINSLFVSESIRKAVNEGLPKPSSTLPIPTAVKGLKKPVLNGLKRCK